jgi:hypothetical protein
MSLINPAQLTWNGEEIKTMAEAVFTSVYQKPDINIFHTVVTPIEAKKQIAYLGLLGLVGKKSSGCSPTSDAKTIPMSEKYWNPEDIFVRLEQCWKDLDASFWVWAQRKGLERADLTVGDFADFVVERLADALQELVLRIAWFNDTAAALVTDSPAGNVTAGTDITYFNIIDGLWKQIFAICTSAPARLCAISENAQATYVTQDNLAADRALKVYQCLKYNADNRLRNQPDLVIISTTSLVDNYEKYLMSQSITPSYEKIMAGFDALKFNNIPIIGFNFWDRYIRTYFDNGTKYHLPHRAILTTKRNLLIGTDNASALSETDVHYDKVTKKNYWDVAFKEDAKVLEDYMIQAAY